MTTPHFINRFVELGEAFYQRIDPTPVANPGLISFNHALSDALRLPDSITVPGDQLAIFSGNKPLAGSQAVATAYSGHQFGHFNPGLGDGRAILLAQVDDAAGQQYDIQLKGSGRTRFSRGGDGRSALGPVLREYLLSEAMHQLGVPTTRALAAVTTGEQVARESLKPGGIITRVATSFVRVGSFQYFANRDDVDAIRKLADYIIRTNYQHLTDAAQPYLKLLDAVIDRQASLIARWMQLGFIHGVMNTDNMSIAGETIDYGPCAFMDQFAHDQVYSSIDRHGRYAYNQQPNIGLWNLTRFAETLLPLLADDEEKAVEIAKISLEGYIAAYQQYWIDGMRSKIGVTQRMDIDKALIDELFDIMHTDSADFTLTFQHLSQLQLIASEHDEPLLSLYSSQPALASWLEKWRQRLRQESSEEGARQRLMNSVNPVYIPRNHQVEAVIRAAEDDDDFSPFHALYEVLQQPYRRQAGKQAYEQPPEPHQVVQQTFCGT